MTTKNSPLLAIAPMQWSSLSDLAEVAPLDDSDAACLKAIQEVLTAHGKGSRFGITLLHSHFVLAEDEILLETPDPETRTLVSRVAPRSDAEMSIPTMWMLGDGATTDMASWYCKSYCWAGVLGHSMRHTQKKSK